jgi:IS5 family transposase
MVDYLKGELGDALNAILCGAGHNIRLILRQLRIFLPLFWKALWRFWQGQPAAQILWPA